MGDDLPAMPDHPPSNSDLMSILIRMTNDRASDRVLLTTLKESYDRRKAEAAKFEKDMRVQIGTLRFKIEANSRLIADLQKNVAIMRPVVKRWQTRELLRRALRKCIGRWWGLLTTIAVALAGLVVWLGDHWAKVAGFLRKIAGQ